MAGEQLIYFIFLESLVVLVFVSPLQIYVKPSLNHLELTPAQDRRPH